MSKEIEELAQKSALCRYCALPQATQDDWDDIPEGEGEHLCWDECGKDAEAALDRVIAEMDAMKAEAEELRQQLSRSQASGTIWFRRCYGEDPEWEMEKQKQKDTIWFRRCFGEDPEWEKQKSKDTMPESSDYSPGIDCQCSARSESECGCDADWTPTEVYNLRKQLKSMKAEVAKYLGLWDRATKELETLKFGAESETGSASCSACGGLSMIPGIEDNDDVMNTPCFRCNPDSIPNQTMNTPQTPQATGTPAVV